MAHFCVLLPEYVHILHVRVGSYWLDSSLCQEPTLLPLNLKLTGSQQISSGIGIHWVDWTLANIDLKLSKSSENHISQSVIKKHLPQNVFTSASKTLDDESMNDPDIRKMAVAQLWW